VGSTVMERHTCEHSRTHRYRAETDEERRGVCKVLFRLEPVTATLATC
jgi:hypothetical protein